MTIPLSMFSKPTATKKNKQPNKSFSSKTKTQTDLFTQPVVGGIVPRPMRRSRYKSAHYKFRHQTIIITNHGYVK